MSTNHPNIIVYGFKNCPYCEAAKKFLEGQKLPFDYLEAKENEKNREEMLRVGKGKTYPQIIINGQAIGGYTDMMDLYKSGELTKLIGQ
jgi:glutaredoxin